MKNKTIAWSLFWIGLIFAITFAGIIGRGFYHDLRTLTAEEIETTIWAIGGPLQMLWGFSVTLGSLLAGIAAFIYVKSRPAFPWLTTVGVLGAVFAMVIVWSRVYDSTLFGIGGCLILVSFFAIVWNWMKQYAELSDRERTAGSFKLVGYIFWINASWFLCGETAKMHLKAFEGAPVPSPIEILAFLALGWVFVLIGEYKARLA